MSADRPGNPMRVPRIVSGAPWCADQSRLRSSSWALSEVDRGSCSADNGLCEPDGHRLRHRAGVRLSRGQCRDCVDDCPNPRPGTRAAWARRISDGSGSRPSRPRRDESRRRRHSPEAREDRRAGELRRDGADRNGDSHANVHGHFRGAVGPSHCAEPHDTVQRHTRGCAPRRGQLVRADRQRVTGDRNARQLPRAECLQRGKGCCRRSDSRTGGRARSGWYHRQQCRARMDRYGVLNRRGACSRRVGAG